MLARPQPAGASLGRLLMGLSLATDLARDMPMESALRTCLFALELGAGMGEEIEPRTVFYVALLRFMGCTAYAHELTHQVGTDDRATHRLALLQALEGRAARSVISAAAVGRVVGDMGATVVAMQSPERRRELAASQCEIAARLAERLGLGLEVVDPLRHAFERWNGGGVPCQLVGEAIHPVARVVQGGYLLDLALRALSPDEALALVRASAGESLDPAVAEVALERAPHLVELSRQQSIWDELDAKVPSDTVTEQEIEPLARAFADFADLKSVWRLGHSPAVAALAEAACERLGLGLDAYPVRIAGLLHDIGLVGVSTSTLDKRGPLSTVEIERLRLHPYHTVRILSQIPQLREVMAIAGGHHERLDGSGYPMATTTISLGARLLAASDVYTALREERPHRHALGAREASRTLEAAAREGQLDPAAVEAVLAAAGAAPSTGGSRPTLTPRQLEVLRLIAIGRTEKEVAQALSLSPRTVHHHVSHIYERIGVSTRAGAALFAVENGLLARS